MPRRRNTFQIFNKSIKKIELEEKIKVNFAKVGQQSQIRETNVKKIVISRLEPPMKKELEAIL